MIRRLVEAHYFQHRDRPTVAQIKFWLAELRTSALLVEVAQSHPEWRKRLLARRPLLAKAVSGKTGELERALREEETAERERDKLYWVSLRRELEGLRHAK